MWCVWAWDMQQRALRQSLQPSISCSARGSHGIQQRGSAAGDAYARQRGRDWCVVWRAESAQATQVAQFVPELVLVVF